MDTESGLYTNGEIYGDDFDRSHLIGKSLVQNIHPQKSPFVYSHVLRMLAEPSLAVCIALTPKTHQDCYRSTQSQWTQCSVDVEDGVSTPFRCRIQWSLEYDQCNPSLWNMDFLSDSCRVVQHIASTSPQPLPGPEAGGHDNSL